MKISSHGIEFDLILLKNSNQPQLLRFLSSIYNPIMVILLSAFPNPQWTLMVPVVSAGYFVTDQPILMGYRQHF